MTLAGEELLSVTEPEFGEITDRGVNFDYLDPALRPPPPRVSPAVAAVRLRSRGCRAETSGSKLPG